MSFAHNSLTSRCFLSDSVKFKESEDAYVQSYKKLIIIKTNVNVTSVNSRRKVFNVNHEGDAKLEAQFDELFRECVFFMLNDPSSTAKYRPEPSMRNQSNARNGYYITSAPQFSAPAIYEFTFAFSENVDILDRGFTNASSGGSSSSSSKKNQQPDQSEKTVVFQSKDCPADT